MKKKQTIVILYVVTIVALLSATFVRLYRVKRNTAETVQAILTLRVSSVHEEISSCVEAGEEIYTVDGEYVGRITHIQSTPHCEELYAAGDLYTGVPNGSKMVDIEVKLAISGQRHNGRLLSNANRPLFAGQRMELCSLRTHLTYEILQIDAEEP